LKLSNQNRVGGLGKIKLDDVAVEIRLALGMTLEITATHNILELVNDFLELLLYDRDRCAHILSFVRLVNDPVAATDKWGDVSLAARNWIILCPLDRDILAVDIVIYIISQSVAPFSSLIKSWCNSWRAFGSLTPYAVVTRTRKDE
jgi:hypothetical protein